MTAISEQQLRNALAILRRANELADAANQEDMPPISVRLEVADRNLRAARFANSARELAATDEERCSAERIFEQAMTAVRVWSDIPARLMEDRYKHV